MGFSKISKTAKSDCFEHFQKNKPSVQATKKNEKTWFGNFHKIGRDQFIIGN